jgi:phage terminase large subunit-like protein
MDEFQQWRNGKALYDIIADGVSARDNPMIFMTSTAGTVREDIYDTIYDECEMIINGYDDPDGYKDEHTLPIIYELDEKAEYTNRDMWIKANPNLGVSKSYAYLEEKVNRAILNPSDVKNLVCKEFNIRETAGEAWLSFPDIDNREKFDIAELKPRYGIGGFDLSQTTDLTAAVVIFMLPESQNIYVIPMFWMPEDEVERHVKEDKIPYDKWIEQKYVRTCHGNKIDYKDVKDWFLEMQNENDIYLPWIGFDSWSATYLVNELQDHFGKQAMEAVIQGKKTLSSPMLDLGADFKAHRVVYNNNPVLKWCLTNVGTDTDINGNVQPIKSTNARQRIDGFAALLNAKVALSRHLEEYLSII